MITREQIEKHCSRNYTSDLLHAVLDRDYQAKYLDYILPTGTIVQVGLDDTFLAMLYVNGEWVDFQFPYDAATLLETEE